MVVERTKRNYLMLRKQNHIGECVPRLLCVKELCLGNHNIELDVCLE
jgi:hypothetical protein